MIDFTGIKAITIPEGKVKQIVRKNDGAVLWAGITNWITKAINTDGTPYRGANGEIGYKTGYRFNTANAETSSSAAAFSVTGYIPAASKDMFYFSKGCMPAPDIRDIRMVLYDSSFNLLGGSSTKDIYNNRNSSQLITDGLTYHDDYSLATIAPYTLRYWVSATTANKTAYVRFSTYTTSITSGGIIAKNEPI